jgi:FkbM family methyltransferase
MKGSRMLESLYLFLKRQSHRLRAYRAKRKFNVIRFDDTDIAIDCGANVGDVTAYWSTKSVTVFSFEPNPYAFRVLSDRFKHNTNVHCLEKAVGLKDARGRLHLHQNANLDQVYWSTGSSMLPFKGNVLEDSWVDVEVVDLRRFILNLGRRVKVMKIDVEGSECEILTGLIEAGVVNMIDYMFVECHDRKIPELRKDTQELRRLIKKRNLQHINLDWI